MGRPPMKSVSSMTIPALRRRLLTLALPGMLAIALPAFGQSAEPPAAPAAQPTVPTAQSVPPAAAQPAVPAAPDPKAQDVLKQARAAIGGDATLAKVQSL